MLLFIDTETGGLDPLKHSLLTVAAKVVIDDACRGNYSANIIPPDGIYHVTHAAMSINNLDLRLEEFAAKDPAFDNVTSREMFLGWLHATRSDIKDRYIVVGWNTPFDLSFIYEHFIDKYTWAQYVDRRYIDLCSVAGFLKEIGLISPKNCHLNTVAEYFDIETPAQHTAMGDVETTYLIWQRLKELTSKLVEG